MLYEYVLNKQAILSYAKRWAFARAPGYFDFDTLGGDCTNFISQCIYAGGAVMNYTGDIGWYYISLNDRSAAWTGVEYFYHFILTNIGAGPFGEETDPFDIKPCDVIQLGGSEGYHHSLLVIDVVNGEPYVAAHSYDAYYRPLSSYNYVRRRNIRIIGARNYK